MHAHNTESEKQKRWVKATVEAEMNNINNFSGKIINYHYKFQNHEGTYKFKLITSQPKKKTFVTSSTGNNPYQTILAAFDKMKRSVIEKRKQMRHHSDAHKKIHLNNSLNDEYTWLNTAEKLKSANNVVHYNKRLLDFQQKTKRHLLMTNEEITDLLEEARLRIECTGINESLVKALSKTITDIKNNDKSVSELYLYRPRDLKKVVKSGRTRNKVKEIITTGKLSILDYLRRHTPDDVNNLLKINQIGPTRAQRLYDQFGIENIKDLKKIAQKGKLKKMKGIGKKIDMSIRSYLSR